MTIGDSVTVRPIHLINTSTEALASFTQYNTVVITKLPGNAKVYTEAHISLHGKKVQLN